MNILIIGNGFDLAHELKTSYKDFLNFYNIKNINDFEKDSSNWKNKLKTNLWMMHFQTVKNSLGDNWIDLEQEIFDVIESFHLSHIDGTFTPLSDEYPQILSMDFKLELNLKQIGNKMGHNDKYDFTKEATDYIIENIENLKIKQFYFKDIKAFANFLYEELRFFTKCFENYLLEDVGSKIKEAPRYNLLFKGNTSVNFNNLRILNFNYTNTFEKIYGDKYSYNFNDKTKPVYIHGKASNSSECSLVLGAKSFKSKNNDGKILPCFNVFKKHNQRHKYNTVEDYQNLSWELKNMTANGVEPKIPYHFAYHIIGHSLNSSDHEILKDILTIVENAPIYIYYYNEETHQDLIDNISEIVEERNVLTRVRFVHLFVDKRSFLQKTNAYNNYVH